MKPIGGIRCALFIASDETQFGNAEHAATDFTGSGSFTVSVANEGAVEAKIKLMNATDMKRMLFPLNPAHQQEDDQNHKDQAKPATRKVTPLPAVRPGGQGADQQQNQDDD